jgi:hypothetical protein
VSERWVSLCDGLREYQAPHRGLAIAKERKWELVSAFQKSIRRGDKQIALRLVSAMDRMPTEWAYFWRRLCVIACEDIGPGDDTLTAFRSPARPFFPRRKLDPRTTTCSVFSLNRCVIFQPAAAFTAAMASLSRLPADMDCPPSGWRKGQLSRQCWSGRRPCKCLAVFGSNGKRKMTGGLEQC